MKRLSIFFLSLLLILGGCANYKSVDIEAVKLASFRMESSTKAVVSFTITVDNPTNTSISLVGLDGVLRKDLDRFAIVELADTATIAPSTTEDVIVTIDITLCDPMSLLSMGLNIRSWKAEAFTVTGKATFRSGMGGKKSFKMKDVPVNKLMKYFSQK